MTDDNVRDVCSLHIYSILYTWHKDCGVVVKFVPGEV